MTAGAGTNVRNGDADRDTRARRSFGGANSFDVSSNVPQRNSNLLPQIEVEALLDNDTE